jgi:hypothetical protein
MRLKFLTISALALCCLFLGRPARADSAPASLKTADGFTNSCMQSCGYNTKSFHVPLFERGVFSDHFGDRFFKIENPWVQEKLMDPDRFVDARPAIVPAPEPSSLLLTCMGLVGLGFFTKGMRRRRPLSQEAVS